MIRRASFLAAALAASLWAGSSALADEVVLTSGETLTVTNVYRGGGKVQFDHPLLGHLEIDELKVKEIRGPDGAPKVPPAPPAPPPPPPPTWKFRAELGLNGEKSDKSTQDLRAAVGALLETPTDRWKFDAAYLRSRTDGETTKNQWYVQGLKDWMFKDSPWLVFATGRFERDTFQIWRQRVSIGGGAGYKLVDTDDVKLRARAGFDETREWDSGDDRWRPEGLLGVDGSWKINKAQSFEGSVTWYPDLKQGGDWRLVSTLAWAVKLSETEALSLKIGLEDEYDTHRVAPFQRNDLKYFVALLYEF